MRVLTLILCVACSALGGCAYFTNYTRGIDLNNTSYAMDVKQRVVFSQKRKYADDSVGFNVICAEPSPDALTVLGATSGLSFDDGERVANLAAGLAESGAFVGLRTQSIQLLRDAMYRLCEGWASGAVSTTDFSAMQRRYQSTMLGLIAIEQLTGPVVAGQALLTTAAAAQGGAGIGDTSVDKARERISAASATRLAVEAEFDKAKARDTKARKDLQVINDKIRTEEGKKEPNQETISSLKDQIPSAQQEIEDARLTLIDSRRRLESASEEEKSAQNDLRKIQSKALASTSGGGALSAIAESQSQSNVALTNGVVKIVAEINSSYTKDACLALMTELVRDPLAVSRIAAAGSLDGSVESAAAILNTSLKVCGRILEVEAQRAESSSNRQ